MPEPQHTFELAAEQPAPLKEHFPERCHTSALGLTRGNAFADMNFQGAFNLADSLTWMTAQNDEAGSLRLIPADILKAAARMAITNKVHQHGVTLEAFQGKG